MVGCRLEAALSIECRRTLVQCIHQQFMDTEFAAQLQAALQGVLQQCFAQASPLFLQSQGKACEPRYGDGVMG
jgi:hypothetical protein